MYSNHPISMFLQCVQKCIKITLYTIGHDIAIDGANQPLEGGQDQVGGPHVPLQDHGDEIETLNWACKSYWLCLVDPINSYVMANRSYMPSLGSLFHHHCLYLFITVSLNFIFSRQNSFWEIDSANNIPGHFTSLIQILL